jgi:DNA-binding protein YbaB
MKDITFKSFDEALETYKAWKQKLADYYISDEKLKRDAPEMYEILINTAMNDMEMKKIMEVYQKEMVITYSDKLISDDYDLD